MGNQSSPVQCSLPSFGTLVPGNDKVVPRISVLIMCSTSLEPSFREKKNLPEICITLLAVSNTAVIV